MKKSRNGIALVMIIVQTLMPQAVLEAQAAEETTPAYTDACKDYFTGWSDGVTTNPRTLTVEGDTNIVAEFGKLQTVNIIVAANDTLRGTVAGTGSYVVGSNATLSATASAHYLFEQWSDGRTDNPRTVRVIADATYTAVFVPMQYNIILSQNNADMVTQTTADRSNLPIPRRKHIVVGPKIAPGTIKKNT